MEKEIENLIVKFLVKEANLDELKQLELWIGNPKNEIVFFEYIKANAYANMAMNTYNEKDAKKRVIRRIKKERKALFNKSRSNYILKYAVAATLIGVIATIYFYRSNVFDKPTSSQPVIVNTNTIEPGTNKATLTLEDGSNIILEGEKSFKNKTISNNAGKLIYNSENNKASEIVYNYLTIPRGGEYYIKLSDGTQVWLNSESQLKFPKAFVEGKTREVELVYGEAYFDVSPSTEHNGVNFKVHNRSQSIDVLGTEFNLKAYRDEFNVYTTLVEGKVVVDLGDTKHHLIPNEQSNLNIETRHMGVSVVDVEDVISWKNGIFSFKGKPLKDIMKVISRWYDVDVVFENKDLEAITFKGVLGKDQNIEEILEAIKTLSVLKEYKIANNIIILK